MQYHYVVMYDSEFDEWRVDLDTTANLDGNIFDPDAPLGQSWHWAQDNSDEDELDGTLIRLLESVMGSIPTPARTEA